MVTNTEKKPVDWEGAERDYRAGLMSVREIAAVHGVSHPAVLKRAKTEKWDRDLAAKIKAKAEAKVTKAAVTREVTAAMAVTENEIVEANAEAIMRVRLGHRTDIATSRTLAMELLAELKAVTSNRELFEQLGERMFDPDRNGVDRLNELYQKVISLGGRTKTMKDLADTLKTLIALEREAFGMTVVGTTPNSYEQNLKDLAG